MLGVSVSLAVRCVILLIFFFFVIFFLSVCWLSSLVSPLGSALLFRGKTLARIQNKT